MDEDIELWNKGGNLWIRYRILPEEAAEGRIRIHKERRAEVRVRADTEILREDRAGLVRMAAELLREDRVRTDTGLLRDLETEWDEAAREAVPTAAAGKRSSTECCRRLH